MLTRLLVGCIWVYQRMISPFLPRACRFYPSCSQYCVLSLQKHGPFKGLYFCFRRLGRCHPYHPGGIDFP